MDQNRCLLDVINDPQLLQSFLESAPNEVTNNSSNINASLSTTLNKDNNVPSEQTNAISNDFVHSNETSVHNIYTSSATNTTNTDTNEELGAVTSIISSIVNETNDAVEQSERREYEHQHNGQEHDQLNHDCLTNDKNSSSYEIRKNYYAATTATPQDDSSASYHPSSESQLQQTHYFASNTIASVSDAPTCNQNHFNASTAPFSSLSTEDGKNTQSNVEHNFSNKNIETTMKGSMFPSTNMISMTSDSDYVLSPKHIVTTNTQEATIINSDKNADVKTEKDLVDSSIDETLDHCWHPNAKANTDCRLPNPTVSEQPNIKQEVVFSEPEQRITDNESHQYSEHNYKIHSAQDCKNEFDADQHDTNMQISEEDESTHTYNQNMSQINPGLDQNNQSSGMQQLQQSQYSSQSTTNLNVRNFRSNADCPTKAGNLPSNSSIPDSGITSLPVSSISSFSNTSDLTPGSVAIKKLPLPTNAIETSPIALPQASTPSTSSTVPSTPASPIVSTTPKLSSSSKPSASKRAPRKTPASKQPRGKNAKSSSPSVSSSTIASAPQSAAPNQLPGPQHIMFQNTNSGIRQPAILSSSLGQSLGGIPQQQRLIQIQTPNGPMYFAIAPGPAAINNNTIVNQTGMQSQFQSQQLCFQTNSSVMMNRPQLGPNMQQQQPRQQIQTSYMSSSISTTGPQTNFGGQVMNDQLQQTCVSSASNIPSSQSLQVRFSSPSPVQYNGQQALQVSASNISGKNINGLQQTSNQYNSQTNTVLVQSRNQTFNQQSSQGGNAMINNSAMLGQQQSQQQHRLASPSMSGHQIAINSQQQSSIVQTSQQQMVIPGTSSSQMMMPRVTNQIILNRPAGQLLPGQQQFIQIQTPNGPMLLALPTQPTQSLNNSMIDYDSQRQTASVQPQIKLADTTPGSNQQNGASNKKLDSKSDDFDLADLLLEHGILPEDKNPPFQISVDHKPRTTTVNPITTQVPTADSSSIPAPSPRPQQQSLPMSTQSLQQPIRIAFSDGQMIFQQPMYGAMRPILAAPMGQNFVSPAGVIPSSSPMRNISSPLNSTNEGSDKKASEPKSKSGKSSATKRSRSKKSDIDKFPTLKTPKRQQQQQQQQQMQAVTAIVPINVIVDQGKVLGSSNDVKANVGEIGAQQVSLAKIVTPVVQSSSIQDMINSSSGQTIKTTKGNINTNNVTQNQTNCVLSQGPQLFGLPSTTTTPTTTIQTNTNVASSGDSINSSNLSSVDIKNQTSSQKPETASSSTSHSISDTLKIDQNAVRTREGLVSAFKVGQSNGPITLVLHQSQAQQLQAQSIQQQKQQQAERRSQSIKNQLTADQAAAINPQTKQSFVSLEDACKKLLRYHVFDTPTVTEEQMNKVDDVFEAAAEKLLSKKEALYSKFRLMMMKQSMESVPTVEDLMIEQILLTEEQEHLKRERELLEEFEAHVETKGHTYSRAKDPNKEVDNMTIKDDCATDYMAFGDNSPKYSIQDDQNNVAQSKQVDEWLMADKWSKSCLSDNEAALAIESILEDEIS